jgi:2-polyprenyl-3-methyl-5-hydroxy-6-metoxy-1,4-benzoquinol methylase
MKTRSDKQEQLDNLSLQGEPLHKALKSLGWINKWFGNHRSTVKSILNVYDNEKKPLTIIDLGCGGGDLILVIAKALRKKGVQFSIVGIDGNNSSLQYAGEKCAGFGEITFQQADILHPAFKPAPCDILITSHFIYHFPEAALIEFMNNKLTNVATAFICSELERSDLALFLFKLTSFLLPISKLAKQDGQLAIKRSFTKKEWLSVLKQTNIENFRLRRIPLFRIQLVVFRDNKI